MLVSKGRLRLDRDVLLWINQALSRSGVELLGLTPSIAVRSSDLGAEFQGDPADRFIAATAATLAAPLVTCDRSIRLARVVRTVW